MLRLKDLQSVSSDRLLRGPARLQDTRAGNELLRQDLCFGGATLQNCFILGCASCFPLLINVRSLSHSHDKPTSLPLDVPQPSPVVLGALSLRGGRGVRAADPVRELLVLNFLHRAHALQCLHIALTLGGTLRKHLSRVQICVELLLRGYDSITGTLQPRAPLPGHVQCLGETLSRGNVVLGALGQLRLRSCARFLLVARNSQLTGLALHAFRGLTLVIMR